MNILMQGSTVDRQASDKEKVWFRASFWSIKSYLKNKFIGRIAKQFLARLQSNFAYRLILSICWSDVDISIHLCV